MRGLGHARKGAAALAAALLLLSLLMLSMLETSPMTPSPYNTYTLQALAWRKGQAFLDGDVPYLELAIYQGRYFVSFPPFPSVPVFLLTFLFGSNVPDGLLNLLYGLLALLVAYRLLLRKGFPAPSAAFWAFAGSLSSSLLPLLWSGAVWYQAQVLAFLLILCAVERMDADRPVCGLLFYALSVGCRPFNALYGPLLLLLYMKERAGRGHCLKSSLLRLLPGILLGLFVALTYAAYNWHRFDNPFEFGHSHLPEFSFQGGTQFSIRHLGKNIREYVFSLPFDPSGGALGLKKFGFSLFLANPLLLLLPLWALRDALKRAFSLKQAAVLAFFFTHLFFLLLHRTFGGYQYGARYAADLLPYALLYLAAGKRKKPAWPEIVLMLLGFALAVWGSLAIRL